MIKLKAFTLIELLVVIVIIGILATISTATYRGYIESANLTKELVELKNNLTTVQGLRIQYEGGAIPANALLAVEMEVVGKAINLARKKEDKVLTDITGHYCSDCDCRGVDFVGDAGTSIALECINRWKVITDIIDSTASIDLSFLHTDPWGSPYLIDENEKERSNNPCRKDTIFSAGPDHLHEAVGETASGDGHSIRLDFYDKETCPS